MSTASNLRNLAVYHMAVHVKPIILKPLLFKKNKFSSDHTTCKTHQITLSYRNNWMWIWANSGRQWRTEEPGVLQSMGSGRVGHSWVTEQPHRSNRSGNWGQVVTTFLRLVDQQCFAKTSKTKEEADSISCCRYSLTPWRQTSHWPARSQ